MRIKLLTFGTCLLLLISCSNPEVENNKILNPDWNIHLMEIPDGLAVRGKSYLSTYSQIYTRSDERVKDLCVTVSIRNMNSEDTIYISHAGHYDNRGNEIHDYLLGSIAVLPLETLEIVIDEMDNSGGTGGNFIFDWQTDSTAIEPLFEAVMISTTGQQGISFLTKGHRIK